MSPTRRPSRKDPRRTLLSPPASPSPSCSCSLSLLSHAPSQGRHCRHVAKLATRSLRSLLCLTQWTRGLTRSLRIHPTRSDSLLPCSATSAAAIDEHTSKLSNSPCRPPLASPIPPLASQGHASASQIHLRVNLWPFGLSLTSSELPTTSPSSTLSSSRLWP